METAVEKRKYTYAEYLQLEKETDVRHEFWNGEVFRMAGGTRSHSDICFNITRLVNDAFRPRGCQAYQSDVKLELRKENYYVYPDVILTCDKDDNDAYFVKNPSLIVEVLSKSTEGYDRSIKLAQYRKIKSLRYYLLVSQSSTYVEIFGRKNENDLFTYDVAEGIDATIELPALDFALPMSKVYEYIEFAEEV